MIGRIVLAAGWALLAGGAPAWAQTVVTSPGPERAAVVIYRDEQVDTVELLQRSLDGDDDLRLEGLALIVETRTIDLPAGEAVIRLEGVADGIAPQTAVLEGLPADVIERNTDFDLLSPASLLRRSVGDIVRVVRTNPATGEQVEKAARVVAGPNGTVLEVDGRLEALNCSGLTERILFDRVPEGLGQLPTLSIRTRAREAGRHMVTLAYLATGLQWSADYVAELNPGGRSLSLTGWITLANFGGASFRDAPVQVVAGQLNRDDDTGPVEPFTDAAQPQCWPFDTTTGSPIEAKVESRDMLMEGELAMISPSVSYYGGGGEDIVVTGSRIALRADLGDYKIYTLPEPTDVMARQTKQVRFLEQPEVAFTRSYNLYFWSNGFREDEAPRLVLRLKNDERNGLGVPMPGGGISLMEEVAGRRLLAGQATFGDRAVGLPVELRLEETQDISVKIDPGEEEEFDRGDVTWMRQPTTVTVSNRNAEAVEVELQPSEGSERGFRVVRSSQRIGRTQGGQPAWIVRVPAGGTVTLTYEIEYEYS